MTTNETQMTEEPYFMIKISDKDGKFIRYWKDEKNENSWLCIEDAHDKWSDCFIEMDTEEFDGWRFCVVEIKNGEEEIDEDCDGVIGKEY